MYSQDSYITTIVRHTASMAFAASVCLLASSPSACSQDAAAQPESAARQAAPTVDAAGARATVASSDKAGNETSNSVSPTTKDTTDKPSNGADDGNSPAQSPGAAIPAPAVVSPSAVTPAPKVGTGSIVGDVTNEEQLPLQNAAVKIVHSGKHEKVLETKTDDKGQFIFRNLEPGRWKVTVIAPGMLSNTSTVDVVAGQAIATTATMEPVEAADVLKVLGRRTQIDPGETTTSTQIDRRYIEQIGSGDSLRRVIETAPGVSRDSVGNIVTRGEHNAVNYEIDGVILPEAAGVLQLSQPASPRSLQSMNVEIGGYEAKDGGGPLGAIVHMRSRPIAAKPTFTIGTQLGGPMAGGINYYASSALSQDPNSNWNKVRVESSGNFFGRKLGLETPSKSFRRNGRFDLNTITKVQFEPNEKNRFTFTAAFNETYLHQPTQVASRRAGFKVNQHDRQNYLILSYRRKFEKYFDEGHLHIVNAFYSSKVGSTNVFDPAPIINGEEQTITSTAFQARRYNYALSIQGDVSKTVHKTHHFVAGFLTEARPVKTSYDQFTYNADPRLAASTQADQTSARQQAQQAAEDARATAGADASAAAEQAQADAAQTATDTALANGATENAAAATGAFIASTLPSPTAASAQAQAALQTPEAAGDAAAASTPVIGVGQLISPFTGTQSGPQFQGIGKYRGFRYLQSGYLQDTWRPQAKFLKRFTFDAGVRADVYHGVFGNSMALANTIVAIPGVGPFNTEPFKRHSVTNAQVSGRYSISYLVTKNTVLRGSLSDVFTPPPVDIFIQPINVTEGTFPFNGIFNGSPRPMQAMRGRLVDVGIQQQVGSRFSMKHNLFYKQLRNFGDSGVIANTVVYNRLTLPKQQSYGMETRLELKPSRDGTGFYGFVSNTFGVVKLLGNKLTSGGQWDQSTEFETTKYVDHDRREYLQAALGYKSKGGFWTLADVSASTGFKNGRDPTIFGPHPARSPSFAIIGLNAGYEIPKEIRKGRKFMPTGVEVRIENITSNVTPINVGSPFQGTRYNLPIRVLSGAYWSI